MRRAFGRDAEGVEMAAKHRGCEPGTAKLSFATAFPDTRRPSARLPFAAGTSAATSMSLLLEPAFVSQGAGDRGQSPARPPLYFAQPNCSALSDDDAATLGRIGEVSGHGGRESPQSHAAPSRDHAVCVWGGGVGGRRGRLRDTQTAPCWAAEPASHLAACWPANMPNMS